MKVYKSALSAAIACAVAEGCLLQLGCIGGVDGDIDRVLRLVFAYPAEPELRAKYRTRTRLESYAPRRLRRIRESVEIIISHDQSMRQDHARYIELVTTTRNCSLDLAPSAATLQIARSAKRTLSRKLYSKYIDRAETVLYPERGGTRQG